MPGKRSYGDACGIARALDAVGERWSLMIVRELVLGPKRFTDIRDGLPGLGPDVLAQRLRDLEANEIVQRRTLPPPAASKVYELTPAGAALEPVLVALGRWGGANAPPPSEGMCMSLDAHILSLRTLFDPALARGLKGTIALRIDGTDFTAVLRSGRLAVDKGAATGSADAVITGDAGSFLGLIRGVRELAEAREAGDVQVEGDEELVAGFIGLFPLPEPAAAA